MKFDQAFDTLLDPQHEGGYSNDPADTGGETYKGVSRKWHPTWAGWPLIDSHKADATFPKPLDVDQAITAALRAFYLAEFWTPAGCEQVPEALRFDLFDMAVNFGVAPAVKALQHAAGAGEDGTIGPKTLAAIASSSPACLLFRFDAARLVHYAESSDAQWLRFGRGWIRRVATNMTEVEL